MAVWQSVRWARMIGAKAPVHFSMWQKISITITRWGGISTSFIFDHYRSSKYLYIIHHFGYFRCCWNLPFLPLCLI